MHTTKKYSKNEIDVIRNPLFTHKKILNKIIIIMGFYVTVIK